MLGRSHKEVVEMLKSVPMGQSVDVVLRRGYPMLYNPDGCPKHSLDTVRRRLFIRTSGVVVRVYMLTPPDFSETAKDTKRGDQRPKRDPWPDAPHLQPTAGCQRQLTRSNHFAVFSCFVYFQD